MASMMFNVALVRRRARVAHVERNRRAGIENLRSKGRDRPAQNYDYPQSANPGHETHPPLSSQEPIEATAKPRTP